MFRILSLFIFLISPLLSVPQGVFQYYPQLHNELVNPEVRINSPRPGQALQGIVSIRGNCSIKNFSSARVEFSYDNNPTDTWFIIRTLTEAVSNGLLAQWDTSTITDGIYQVRLVVAAKDGKEYQAIVNGLRVRNCTLIETDTPAPTGIVRAGVFSETPNPTPIKPTPTPLPANPLEISPHNIQTSLFRGGLMALVVFIIIGVFQGLRKLVR